MQHVPNAGAWTTPDVVIDSPHVGWSPNGEFLLIEEATFRAATRAMMTRPDLFAGCNLTARDVWNRVAELDANGELEPLKARRDPWTT